MPDFQASRFRASWVAAASFMITMPAMAQAVISEPGYCAQFYPSANCQNKGPRQSLHRQQLAEHQSGRADMAGDRTTGVAGKRSRTYRYDPSGMRMQ